MSLDIANSVADVNYRLGFVNLAEMTTTSWVTAAELYQYADEAGKKLARETGAFTVWDPSITVTPGTALYALPAGHVYTLFAALVYADGSMQILRLTPAADLWALDNNWPTTAGNAQRASLDAGAPGTITLYPIPDEGGTLVQVLEGFPAAPAAGASTVNLPTVFQDFYSYRMLAAARGKESANADLAMSQHFAQRADLYSQIAAHLFGGGQ